MMFPSPLDVTKRKKYFAEPDKKNLNGKIYLSDAAAGPFFTVLTMLSTKAYLLFVRDVFFSI